MVPSMVKLNTHLSTLRQLLVDNVWREQITNHMLQDLYRSHINRQCYHTSHVCLRKKEDRKKLELRTLFKQGKIDNINIKQSMKKSLPVIEVWKNMTVKELAVSAKREIDDVLDALYIENPAGNYRVKDMLTDSSIIYNVVKKLGGKARNVSAKQSVEQEVKGKDIVRSPPDESVLVKRHPVVTIMGHVDHGKTTLLDALRNTSVVDTEFGGITQHIGAFNVSLESGEKVTFLDTPGHAAFTSMRSRGAHATDIVVLVVAADDGVKDQTLQSIEIAQDAKVPIIVAINKIDKPNADINRTQNMLAEHGVVVEALGGDVQCVHISALKRTNLRELTETIVLQAELMDLKGDPVGLVEGVAIECTTSLGRGKLVTALVKRGTLRKGCLLVSGVAWGKVRAMFNDAGELVLEAKPGDAVQIIGWKEMPNVGDEVLEAKDEKELRSVLQYREGIRAADLSKDHREASDKRQEEFLKEYKKLLAIKREIGLADPVSTIVKSKETVNEDNTPVLNVVIKGDVAGSVEAILDIFDTYTEDKLCRLNVIHYGIGAVTETDLNLARTFNAVIYGFNINIPHQLEQEAKKNGITVRHYNVIYKLFDNLKEEINNRLPEIDAEEILGEAKVQQQFKITEGKKKINVAGCCCTKGVLQKSAMYHIKRGNEIVHTGKLLSMKHLKDEVSSIKLNVECGLRFHDSNVSFEPGDIIVCFKPYKATQTIEWDPGF